MRRLPVVWLALLAAGQSGAQLSGGVIAGQVVDASSNAPVRKALVTLSRRIPTPKEWESSRVEADSSGRFVFGNLPPGSYTLEARATGYIEGDLMTGLPAKAGSPFALAGDQALTGITIRLTPGSVISGRIADEDDDPLADFRVQLFQVIYNSGRKQFYGPAGANTDDRGRYRIAGIPAGKYYLTVSPPVRYVELANKIGSYQPAFYPGVLDFSAARTILVGPGIELENTNLKLSRSPTVRVLGQVMDVTAGSVTLIPGSIVPYISEIEVDIRNDGGANGKFEFKGIPPGDYNVVVRPDSPTPRQRPWVRRPLTVRTSDIEGLTIAVPPPAWIGGRVLVEGNAQSDLPAMYIRIEPAYPNTRMYADGSAKLARDGTFRISGLAPDRYRVRVAPGSTGLYLKAVRIDSRELPGQTLELGASAEIEVILSARTASIGGVVNLEGSGQPAQGATVLLIPQDKDRREDGDAYFTATTDDSGRFTIRNIPPGEYRAYSWETRPRAADYMDLDFIRPVEGKGVSLTLAEGGSASIELTAIPTSK